MAHCKYFCPVFEPEGEGDFLESFCILYSPGPGFATPILANHWKRGPARATPAATGRTGGPGAIARRHADRGFREHAWLHIQWNQETSVQKVFLGSKVLCALF